MDRKCALTPNCPARASRCPEVGKCLGRAIVNMVGHVPLHIEVPRLDLVVRESVRKLDA